MAGATYADVGRLFAEQSFLDLRAGGSIGMSDAIIGMVDEIGRIDDEANISEIEERERHVLAALRGFGDRWSELMDAAAAVGSA